MIGVIGMLIANQAIFLHIHKLNDGTIVEHAHPYDRSTDSQPYKSHHHSTAELLFFENLDLLFLVAFLILPLIALVNKRNISFTAIPEPALIYLNLQRGRAPPRS